MKVSEKILEMIENMEVELNSIEFGNVDFVFSNGEIVRVDIRKSLRPEKEMKSMAKRRT